MTTSRTGSYCTSNCVVSAVFQQRALKGCSEDDTLITYFLKFWKSSAWKFIGLFSSALV